MVEKSKTFTKPKSLRSKLRKPKPLSKSTKKNNFASIDNITKTIQALENLKSPSKSNTRSRNNVFALNFSRNGAPVLLSNNKAPSSAPVTRRVSTRERKPPQRFGFNNNNKLKTKKG
jgi:hypothetical protein